MGGEDVWRERMMSTVVTGHTAMVARYATFAAFWVVDSAMAAQQFTLHDIKASMEDIAV